MSDKETHTPLEDLPDEFIYNIHQQIHSQNIENLKSQGVEVHSFKMELVEVEE